MWDGYSIKNIFDGGFSISGVNSNKNFRMFYENIPLDACIELATQDWGKSNIYKLVFTISCNGIINLNTPVDVGTAVEQCGYLFDVCAKENFTPGIYFEAK